MKPKIVFIHGMFLTDKCWNHWIAYFKQRGYEAEAIPWPLHDAEPAGMRSHPPDGLGSLTLEDLHQHYSHLLSSESSPLVVIGHSLGGLLMQKLAADGLIRAGVGICPVAPNRMLALDWGFLRNTASITNPFAGHEPYEMTSTLFRQNFGNTMSEADSEEAFQAYAVPESRQVLRDIMGDEGKIDLSQPHVPFLFIGAEKDEIIPPTLVRHNAHAYGNKRSHSEYAEFSSRGHFIIAQNGWEEVADKILNWLEAHLNTTRA